MNKIKKGDNIAVLVGKDKGKSGVVRRVVLDVFGKPAKVEVEGINMATCYTRPNPQKNEPGGIVRREALIHASNVAVIEPESGKPSRVRFVRVPEGKKEGKKDNGLQRELYVSKRRRA